ncbi:MAG: 16S rRNA processing protein RimM [Anaerolineaceae bacterium]|jgi:16S rRNA processing protein RimM|nr:MAG: 16S rRNA processing protein RimM [Anaerolineaceae bacterium]
MIQGHSHKKNTDDGSPKEGEPLFLIIGKIRKPHGVRGELLFEILTEFPERIKAGKKVYVGDGKFEQQIESVRFQKENYLIKFKEINDCEKAGIYRNQMVYVQAVDLPKLPKDEYYYHDLIGMQVLSEEGEKIGSVSEIIETGAKEVLVVSQAGKEYLFPFIKQVVLEVNKEESVIIVKLQEWK